MTKYKYILDNQQIETLDLNSIPEGLSYDTIEFDQTTDQVTDPIDIEVLNIQKRRRDGILMYQRTHATLRINRIQENISHLLYNTNVYTPLEKVINQINAGNFIDAHVELFRVEANDYLTENMLLDFKNQVANYILNEGNYSDFEGMSVDPLTGIIS